MTRHRVRWIWTVRRVALAPLLAVALIGCGGEAGAGADAGPDSGVDAGASPDAAPPGDGAIDAGVDAQTTPNGCGRITGELDKGMTGSVGTPSWTARLDGRDVGDSALAYWKYGKRSVLTITFDDSTQGQARYAIPALYARGLVGTFFVNPGLGTFDAERATWDAAYTSFGQEIANHTFLGEGGATEAEAAQVVELASDYIKEHVYGLPPETHKILAFNKGGGSVWYLDTTSEAWNMFVRAHYLFERKYSSGVAPATTSAELIDFVLTAFGAGGNFETTGGSMHFHGICDEVAYPGCDNESVEFPTNNAAVQKGELESFLSWIVDPGELAATTLWIAGYAEYRKYMVVRSGTTVSLEGVDGAGDQAVIHVRLRFDMPSPSEVEPVQYTTTYGLTWGDNNEMGDPDLYTCDPVTVFTKVPATWPAARVTQETGETHVYRVDHGEVRYEAFTDSLVEIRRAEEAEVDIPYVGLPL